MVVMYSQLPVTMSACAIQLCLSLSVELMVLPTSHHAEQAARNTTSMATKMYRVCCMCVATVPSTI